MTDAAIASTAAIAAAGRSGRTGPTGPYGFDPIAIISSVLREASLHEVDWPVLARSWRAHFDALDMEIGDRLINSLSDEQWRAVKTLPDDNADDEAWGDFLRAQVPDYPGVVLAALEEAAAHLARGYVHLARGGRS